MALEVQVDRTLIQPHDVVQVQFRCQNQSSLKVNMVQAKLEQIIEWRANGHRERVSRILDRRDMDASQIPSLQRIGRKKRRHGQEEYFGIPPSPQDSTASDVGSIPSWQLVQLQVSPQSQDSYQGNVLEVRHVLSVHLVSQGCCTTNPEASARLQVFRQLPKLSASPNDVAAAAADPLANATTSASAPSDVYDDILGMTPPSSAPPASYDVPAVTATATAYPTQVQYLDAMAPPMAEAQALPPDWNAQTAQVVDIPMAKAVVLEPQIKIT